MSFLTTNKDLVGRFEVTNHARKRLQDRLGNMRKFNKKVKNLGKNQLDSFIIQELRNNRNKIKDLNQKDGAVKVYSRHFNAIVIPGFTNTVVTILDWGGD